MKTTKLEEVYKFVNWANVFRPKDFEKKFGPYPNTYWTYLTYLKRAGYVQTFNGSTMTVCFGGPATGMSYSQLYREAYGKK